PSGPRLGEGGVVDAHVRGAPAQTVRWTVREVLVPGAGIEPARPKAPDFKSGMSTSSIIRACKNNRLQPFVTCHQRIPERVPGCASGAGSARTQVILSPLRLPISPSGLDSVWQDKKPLPSIPAHLPATRPGAGNSEDSGSYRESRSPTSANSARHIT